MRSAVRQIYLIALTFALLAGSAGIGMADTTTTGAATAATTGGTAAPEGGAATPSTKPRSLLGQRDATAGRRGNGVLDRVMVWVETRQHELNRQLTGSVKALKQQGSAWAGLVLAGIAFLYGVLHAAGPGHGKAIITSYVLADGRTLRRGVAISFLAGFIQALSAIVLVAILAIVLKSTGLAIQATSNRLEQASYALIAVVGAWLLWRALAEAFRPSPAAAHSHAAGHHAHGHDHKHDHAQKEGEPCDHCGHSHLPGPAELEGAWSWRKALALAMAVGVRPCTGAIIVLVFALGQGMFWAGVGATFAMALGTAIAVSVLASMAIGARELAMRMTGTGSVWAGRIETAAGIGGSGLVLLLGVVLFLASLGPARPF